MGNLATRDQQKSFASLQDSFKKFSKDESSASQSYISTDILMEHDSKIILDLYDFMLSEMKATVKQGVVDGIFSSSETLNVELESTENLDAFLAKKALSEIRDQFAAGYKTAESNIADLKYPAHERFFTVPETECPLATKADRELQVKKVQILYSLCLLKNKRSPVQSDTFSDFVEEFLTKLPENEKNGEESLRSQSIMKVDFSFFLGILQELQSISNGDLMMKTLEHLYQTLRNTKPGSIHTGDRYSFMLDDNLNQGRIFLVNLIKDDKSDQRIRNLAYQVLLLLGLARHSVEDLLVLCSLLQQKKPDDLDLREELKILRDIQTQTHSDQGQLPDVKMIQTVTKMPICSTGSKAIKLSSNDQWILDRNYFYALVTSQGLVKLSTGKDGTTPGQVIASNKEFSIEESSMMLLGDKLFIRHKNLADQKKPFIMVDKNTLNPVDEDEIKFDAPEGQNQSLLWTDVDEKGRSLTYTPLITDGKLIYVISRYTPPEDEAAAEKTGYTQLVVEIYDPNEGYKFIRMLTLMKKNQANPFRKMNNTVGFLRTTRWSTNGNLLSCFTNEGVMRFFSLKTGKIVKKIKTSFISQNIAHDQVENKFVALSEVSGIIQFKEFAVTNFEQIQDENQLKFETLEMLQNKCLEEEKSTQKKNLTKMNLIQKIMKGVSDKEQAEEKYKLGSQLKQTQMGTLSRTLILRFLKSRCSTFNRQYNEISCNPDKNSKDVMLMFRYPLVTFLTATTFIELGNNLKEGAKLLNNSQSQDEDHFIELLGLRYLLDLVKANIKALDYCTINLSSLFLEESDYAQFKTSFEGFVTVLANENQQLSTERIQRAPSEELKLLWTSIIDQCREISTSSMRLFDESHDIVNNLKESLKLGKKEKYQAQIAHISQVGIIKSLIKEQQMPDILQIFKDIVKIDSDICEAKLKALKFDNPEKSVLNQEDDDLSKVCQLFIKNLCEEMVFRHFQMCQKASVNNQQLVASTPSAKDIEERTESEQEMIKMNSAIREIIDICFEKLGIQLDLVHLPEPLKEEDESSSQFDNLKFECIMYTQNPALESNGWHFVTITNPSKDGVNFLWQNREKKWKLTANYNEGILSSFNTSSDCPYYENPHNHTLVNLKIQDGVVKGFYGPFEEYYEMVEDFSISITGSQSILKPKSFKINPNQQMQKTENQEFKKKYSDHCIQIFKVLKANDTYLSMTQFFLHSFSVEQSQDYEITRSVCQGAKAVLASNMNIIHNFIKSKQDGELFRILVKWFQNAIWFVGHIAYDLLKSQNSEKKEKDKNKNEEDDSAQKKQMKRNQEVLKMVMQSNLLSGGLKAEHQNLFSVKTKNWIQSFASIIDNKDLINSLSNLNSETSPSKDTKVLDAIINKGQNSGVDLCVDYLQRILETGTNINNQKVTQTQKVMLKRKFNRGGQIGGKMSRAAFAVMIKFCDLTDEFSNLIKAVEIESEMLEDMDNAKKEEAVIEFMMNQKQADKIIKIYESSSRMRSWLDEKKISLEEDFQAQLKKDIPKGQEEAEKVEGEQQIDSSTTKKSKELTEEELQNIDKEAFSRMEQAIEEILGMITTKSNFLIKLNVPVHFKDKDSQLSTDGCSGSFKLLKRHSTRKKEPDVEIGWEDRLRKWRQIQTSKGAIRDLTDIKEEVRQYGITSILALLQTEIDTVLVKKQVEKIFVDSFRRAAGLKLIRDLITLTQDSFAWMQISLSWFNAALRLNKNRITHYLDDTSVKGTLLETIMRNGFFDIMSAIANKIKKLKKADNLKFATNSMMWKFSGSDHAELAKLNLFQALYKGDSLKKLWGQKIESQCITVDEQTTQTSMIELFEQLFLTITARLTKSDIGEEIKIGSNVLPSLTRTQSIMNEKQSEPLIEQAFEVIFKEVQKYVKLMKAFKGVDWSTYVRAKNQEMKDNGNGNPLLNASNDIPTEVDFEIEDEDLKVDIQDYRATNSEVPVKIKFVNQTTDVVEVFCYDKDGKKVSRGKIEPSIEVSSYDTFETHNWCCEGPGFYSLNGEQIFTAKKEEEQIIKNIVIKKENEIDFQKKIVEQNLIKQGREMEKLSKLYSETFLLRLLRLVEVFTSIATCSSRPLSLVQRVTNPKYMSILLQLLITAPPSTKILVLQILQHLVKIQIPFEIFEESMTLFHKDKETYASSFEWQCMQQCQTQIVTKFEKCKFVGFLYNYLYSIKSKMWKSGEAGSDGLLAVSYTLEVLLRHMGSMNCLGDKAGEDQSNGQSWKIVMNEEFTNALVNLDTLPLDEADTILSILGGEQRGLIAGDRAITSTGQTVTILGYSSTWKTADLSFSDIPKAEINKKIKRLKISKELSDSDQMAVALFYEKSKKDQQDMMILHPSSLNPMAAYDEDEALRIGRASPINNPKVLTTLVRIMKADATENSLSTSRQATLRQKQAQILKILCYQTDMMGQEFIDYLQEQNCLKEIFEFLYKGSGTGNEGKGNIIPIKWLESKIQNMKRMALETTRSLSLEQQDVKVKLIDKKELLFMSTDPSTLQHKLTNAYLVSAVNLDMVPSNTVYSCCNSSEFGNSETAASKLTRKQLVALDIKELLLLDDKALNILDSSEAIVTSCPEDLNIYSLYQRMQNIQQSYVKAAQEKEMKSPFKFESILNTVIYFVSEDDFKRCTVLQEKKVVEDENKSSQIERLLDDLGEWAEVDRNLMLAKIQKDDLKNVETVIGKIVGILAEQQEKDEKYKEESDRLQGISDDEALKKLKEEYDVSKQKNLEAASEMKKILETKEELNLGEILVEEKKEENFDKQYFEESSKDEEWAKQILESVKKTIAEKSDQPCAEKEDPLKKEEDMTRQMCRVISDFNVNQIQLEHSQAIEHLLSELRKACLFEIIDKCRLGDILPIVLESQQSQSLFAKYLKMRFNTQILLMIQMGHRDPYLKIKHKIRDILQCCAKSDQLKGFTKLFLVELLQDGIKMVKTFKTEKPKNFKEFFQSEKRAANALNPYVLRFFTSYLIKNDSPEVIEMEGCLPTLLYLHLSMIIYFQDDKKLVTKLLKSCLKLIEFANKHMVQLTKTGDIAAIVQNKLLKLIIEEVNFKDQVSDNKYFTDQQLIFLELHLKIEELGKKAEETQQVVICNNMKYIEAIKNYKGLKMILSENTKFDTLLYRQHCNRLDKDEKDQFNVKIQSHNPSLGTIMTAEVNVPGIEHLTVKFGERTKLQDFAKVGFSQDFLNPDRAVSERTPGQTTFEWPAGCIQIQYPLITDDNTEMYQEKLIHSLPDGNMAMGMLHCYKKGDEWKFVTEDEYEQKKNELPDICWAFKCPIKDIAGSEWQDLEALAKEVLEEVKVDLDQVVHEGVKCTNSGEDIKGPLYHSRYQLNDKEVELNYSQVTVAKYDQHTVNPIIYYRVARPLKKDAKLPIIEIQKYYVPEPDVFLDAEIIPDIKQKKNAYVLEKTKQKWEKIQADDVQFDTNVQREFFNELDRWIVSILSTKSIQEVVIEEDLKVDQLSFQHEQLKNLTEKQIKQKATLYCELNQYFLDILPYSSVNLKKLPGSVVSLIAQNKQNIFACMKNMRIDKDIEKLPRGEKVRVRIARIQAQTFMEAGQCDNTGEYTIFGQLHTRCKQQPSLINSFRMNGVEESAFKFEFDGENANDWGGPFRDALVMIGYELQSDILPLFIRTSNNRNESGEFRDCFVPNPGSNTPTHASMFKCFGHLLGYCIRAKSALDLHFPPIFWKDLLGESLNMSDLDSVCFFSHKVLKEMEYNGEIYDASKFDNLVESERFVTYLTNGVQVELCPGGKDMPVTHSNYKNYIDLVKKVKLSEGSKQMEWIKEGINEIVDLKIMMLLTWEQLESRACGVKTIQTEHFKSITKYNVDKDHAMVKMFWKMFESFTQEERAMYLRFVWGRNRLPFDCSRLKDPHQVRLISSMTQDGLPKSHTCFFQLDIPQYSSLELMKKRFLTAIEYCAEIDDD